MRTREEHIAWCKERALQYIKLNDATSAVSSMLSDLSKHTETEKIGKGMALIGMFYAQDILQAKKFIEGFN